MKTDRGFTLMEMMLVLAVIGMIAAVAASYLTGVPDVQKVSEVKMRIPMLEVKLMGFKNLAARYPTQAEGLMALVSKPAGLTKPWAAALDAEDLVDPWGNAFEYRNPGKKGKSGVDVFSKGGDGQAGTSDDIGNWK